MTTPTKPPYPAHRGEAYPAGSAEYAWYCDAHLAIDCLTCTLLDALKAALDVIESHIASDCDICSGESGWTDEAQPRLTPVQHKEGCAYLVVTAAIAKAEGRE